MTATESTSNNTDSPLPNTGSYEGFATGAVRDSQNGKPRYDLIPIEALHRLAVLYARGAVKYGENNWQKGIPFRRVYASLLRHVFAWIQGDKSEDHLAALAWNAFTLMTYEEWIKSGRAPAELDDREGQRQQESCSRAASDPAAAATDSSSNDEASKYVAMLCELSRATLNRVRRHERPAECVDDLFTVVCNIQQATWLMSQELGEEEVPRQS